METATNTLIVNDHASNPDDGNLGTSSLTTQTPPIIPPASPFPLLDLPPELRLRIFEYLFQSHRVAVQCTNPDYPTGHYSSIIGGGGGDDEEDDYDNIPDRLAITRVNKIVRLESISAFLRTATFDFQLLDYHPTWRPNDILQSYIARMKHIFGPPRLMHYLGITTRPWWSAQQGDNKWMESCNAEHIVCDMVVDQFDISDAMNDQNSSEAKYFSGIKDAIVSHRGAKLTLCVQIEDNDLTYNSWDESHARSAVQVWKHKVIVRRGPRTEPGKVKMRNALTLLGLQLNDKDKHILEPAKQQDAATNTIAGNIVHAVVNNSLALGTAAVSANASVTYTTTTNNISATHHVQPTAAPILTSTSTSVINNEYDENSAQDLADTSHDVVMHDVSEESDDDNDVDEQHDDDAAQWWNGINDDEPY